MSTVSQVGPTPLFFKSCAVLTLSTIGLLCLLWPEFFVCSDKISWKLFSRDCDDRVWSWALGPDEGAYFHLQAQADASLVCVVSLYSQSSQVDLFDHKVGQCAYMSKPRVLRRTTCRELPMLVTTANGPKLLEHVDQPNFVLGSQLQ